jgi:4-amino-4-deoxy-L-arabinose transferase-like glycosyltransferase
MKEPYSMAKSLAVIVAIYLALTLSYAIAIPLWEAPDEPAHFLYANAMAETGSPPAPSPPQRNGFWKEGYVTSAYEWHQPPLYYGLIAPNITVNRSLSLLPHFDSFPEINPPFPLSVRLFVPLPFRFTEIHLLRIISALLGLMTVFTVYGLARRLFPYEEYLPEAAAGFVAFIPQFNFLHAYVTNDTLAILLSALGMASLVYVALASPESQRRAWIWAGGITALALATKMTTWFLRLNGISCG